MSDSFIDFSFYIYIVSCDMSEVRALSISVQFYARIEFPVSFSFTYTSLVYPHHYGLSRAHKSGTITSNCSASLYHGQNPTRLLCIQQSRTVLGHHGHFEYKRET